MSTVPTLAALWPSEQLSGIRLLILGGEACPAKLAHRLAHAARRCGTPTAPPRRPSSPAPRRCTAASRCASACRSTAGSLAVVDPETGSPWTWGGIGELVIGGVGTARYLDPAKDAAKFRPLPALDWDRAYRSGDLVRADPEGLTFIGRADTQVKIRGFRIELAEIESALLRLPGVGQAVVSTYEPAPGLTRAGRLLQPACPGSARRHRQGSARAARPAAGAHGARLPRGARRSSR